VDRIDKAVLALAAALLIYELFTPPVVGMANNGDFGKMIARFNLGAPFENEFKYATTKYNFDSKYHYESGIYSSELILVYAALGLNRLIARDGLVDIRAIGAIHSALFLFTLYLLTPVLRLLPNRVRAALWGLILLVFCDLAYTLYFNSFYMDAAAFLFLALAVVMYVRAARRPGSANALGFVAACLLLIATKSQHCLLALPLAVFVIWKGGTIWPRRPLLFGWAAAALMLCAALLIWKSAPPESDSPPLYTMIFTGILPESKDIGGDLKALGLDDSYARYVGTTGFTVGNLLGDENSLREFKRRTSFLRLGYFFLSHPPTFYRVFSFALGQAGRQRPNLGNFDPSAGRPPYAESRKLILWSRLKRSLYYWKGARYLSYSIAVMVFSSLVAATRASKECVAPVCLLAVAALMEIGIAGLGDAAETTRHCFLFNAILDILLVSGAAMWSTPQAIGR